MRRIGNHVVEHQLMTGLGFTARVLRPIQFSPVSRTAHAEIIAAVFILQCVDIPCLVTIGHALVIAGGYRVGLLTAAGFTAVDDTGFPIVIA